MRFFLKNINSSKNINLYIILIFSFMVFYIARNNLCNPKFYLVFLFINLLLILITWIYNDIKSQIIIIYILTLTAIETGIGLALFKNSKIYYFYILKFMIQTEIKIISNNWIGRILKFILLRSFYKTVYISVTVKRYLTINKKNVYFG